MTCFCVFYVFFQKFVSILKLNKKNASAKYIKKLILNTKQKKNFFPKHYSFNTYFSDKIQILKNIQKRISIFRQVCQIFFYNVNHKII